jgi:hypothetical protein
MEQRFMKTLKKKLLQELVKRDARREASKEGVGGSGFGGSHVFWKSFWEKKRPL